MSRLLFNEVLKGLLKEKCVILVTHQIHYMRDVDHVIVMHEGSVVAQGKFSEVESELMKTAGQIHIVSEEKEKKEEAVKKAEVAAPKKEEQAVQKTTNKNGKLFTNEANEGVKTSMSTYWKYLKFGECRLLFFFTFILFVISEVVYHALLPRLELLRRGQWDHQKDSIRGRLRHLRLNTYPLHQILHGQLN